MLQCAAVCCSVFQRGVRYLVCVGMCEWRVCVYIYIYLCGSTSCVCVCVCVCMSSLRVGVASDPFGVCPVLQCVAVYCNVSQSVALSCSVVQCVAVSCSELQ